MSNPFRLQLALQGGGARIIHLIAALEAVEQLKGQIEVTRIAGTSAGAIAGALFAAGIPMSTVKAEMRAFRSQLSEFPSPSKTDFFTRVVLRGNALAKTTALKTLLTRLFDDAGISTVGDIPDKKNGPVLKIVYADLYSGTPQAARENDNIVTALLDSCAIPFYFRVWNQPRGAFVDGGICENLAVADLRKDQEQYGPIVAISFNRSPIDDPQGWLDYAKALLDTAIHNSVARALQDLGPEHVLPIATNVKTFDFERALSDEGLGSMYDATRSQATLYFQDFLKTRGNNVAPVKGDLWVNQNPDTMRKLWFLYSSTFGKVKYDIERAVYVVQANCLVRPGEPLEGTPDEATYKLTFHTSDEAIHAQKFSHMISPQSDFLGLAELRVFGPPGQDAEFVPTLLPVLRPEVPEIVQALEQQVGKSNVRELVSFFAPPLPPHSGPFTLVFKEFLKNSVAPLKAGHDRLWITPLPRAAGLIKRMDLVLLAPEGFGPVHMVADAGVKNAGIPLIGRGLDEYKEIAPPGFHPVAWTCPNADPTQPFSVSIRLGPGPGSNA
jgi:predicted acylesterase/phospholipase RssA